MQKSPKKSPKRSPRRSGGERKTKSSPSPRSLKGVTEEACTIKTSSVILSDYPRKSFKYYLQSGEKCLPQFSLIGFAAFADARQAATSGLVPALADKLQAVAEKVSEAEAEEPGITEIPVLASIVDMAKYPSEFRKPKKDEIVGAGIRYRFAIVIDDNIPGHPERVAIQTSIPKVGEKPEENMIQVVDWKDLALFQYG